MQDVETVFQRYEAVRHRLPEATFRDDTRVMNSLLEVMPEADAFVFDAFGVLNVGEKPIDGAAERLDDMRKAGRHIRVLTNAASYGPAKTVEKFRRLGMNVLPEEIITSRSAALSGLGPGTWGCIALPEDPLTDIPARTLRLDAELSGFDTIDGVLFLSTGDWSRQRQAALEECLRKSPRPVRIANADLVAPRDDGFSLEPGFFGHRIADAGLAPVTFFGKPLGDVYDMVEASLPGVPPDRIVMCGDTLHTDILGAAARGWRTVLVTRDGLFAGSDVTPYCRRSGIHPDWQVERI